MENSSSQYDDSDFDIYLCAAKEGDAEAQFHVALCYESGDGVEQDFEQAVFWYRQAAEQGDARAQDLLGDCYHKGTGVLLYSFSVRHLSFCK